MTAATRCTWRTTRMAPREVLSYLDKHCMKRVSCAPQILEKRASVGAMSAGDAARFVRNADGCARACANTR